MPDLLQVFFLLFKANMALHLLPDHAEIFFSANILVFQIMSFFISKSANILQNSDS